MSSDDEPTFEFEVPDFDEPSEELMIVRDLEPLEVDVELNEPAPAEEQAISDSDTPGQKKPRIGESTVDLTETIAKLQSDDEETPSRSRVGFGRYTLKNRIGVGGMAEVFLAGIKGPGGFSKACVVKRILPEYADSPEFAQMLANEARISAMLSHQNIVQVFDYGEIDGDYFIAMEYIDGCSLEVLLRNSMKQQSNVGFRIAVQVCSAVADGLHYAHTLRLPEQELHIVHRDVAPGNILVSHAGHVKLADFGVVKSAINQNQTEAGVLKGKFGYMSPEQVRSRPLDRRSDVFSLGIILWELCVGRWLFRSEHVTETIAAVAEAKVPAPSSIIEDFPPDLDAIIMKALTKEVVDRYQSAAELKADLDIFRVRQQWTSGASEIAHYMAQSFPRDGVSSDPPSAPSSGILGPGVSTGGGARRVPSLADDSYRTPVSGPYDSQAAGASASETTLFRAVTVLGCLAATGLFWWSVLSDWAR